VGKCKTAEDIFVPLLFEDHISVMLEPFMKLHEDKYRTKKKKKRFCCTNYKHKNSRKYSGEIDPI
jgi:hypothetical protein